MSVVFLIVSQVYLSIILSHFYLYKLQSSGYRSVKESRFLWIFLLFLLVSIPFELFLRGSVGNYIYGGISLILAIIFTLKYLFKRTKFKYTARAIRVGLPYLIFSISLIILVALFEWCHFVLLSTLNLLSPLILACVNEVIAPLERKRNYKYAFENTRSLRNNGIIKVVITGSYGKTTAKNILFELLKTKYDVVCSLENYNTPLGLVKSIKGAKMVLNSQNSEKTLLFIGEVGARGVGDVSEMCSLIEPTYGIITGVAEQHLESFHSVETVSKVKEELANYIGKNGVVVFNCDNPYTDEMSHRFFGRAIRVGNGGDLVIDNLKMSVQGSTFELRSKDVTLSLKTQLLGAHNVKNIALSVALALELGVGKEEIERVVMALKSPKNRLERRNLGNIIVLDDSYNGNVNGVESATEVLKTYEGRVIVYAQGVVECGRKKREINLLVAKLISEVASVVILSGENAKIIEKGLKLVGFRGEIHKFKSLMHATDNLKHILKSGDILYLQNDIP